MDSNKHVGNETRTFPLTLWDYERWCCVYEPLSDGFGRLVVYSGSDAVLEMPRVSQLDAEDRAIRLRMLAQLATNRLAGFGGGAMKPQGAKHGAALECFSRG